MSKKSENNEYVITDEYVEIIVYSPKYGKFNIIIDVKDMEKVKKYKWGVIEYKGRYRIATSIWNKNKGTKNLKLHRYIMNVSEPNMIVDHINGDVFDNRRSNLRITTVKGNAMNKGIAINNSSGVKGVCWNEKRGKWEAYIMVNRKKIFLGCYISLEAAKIARRDGEIKYFKDYSREFRKKYIIIETIKGQFKNTSKEKIKRLIEDIRYIQEIEVW